MREIAAGEKLESELEARPLFSLPIGIGPLRFLPRPARCPKFSIA